MQIFRIKSFQERKIISIKSLWCERKDLLCFRNRMKAVYAERVSKGKKKQEERSQHLLGHVKEYEF